MESHGRDLRRAVGAIAVARLEQPSSGSREALPVITSPEHCPFSRKDLIPVKNAHHPGNHNSF